MQLGMQLGMLRGIAAFRWGAWAWMAAVLVTQRNEPELQRGWLAWGLVALAFVVTAAATLLVTRSPTVLLRREWLATEVALGVVLSVAGGWVYASDPFDSAHNLASAWPLAGVLSAGVVAGPWAGAGAGLAIALARFFAPIANGLPVGDFETHWLSLASTTLLYVLGGAVAGYAAALLRRAEDAVSVARAREEVARTLHDGVLQTLAIIERRADDPDLARLAREQERDLRTFLFGATATRDGSGAADLGPAVMAAAARFEDAFGARVDVVLAPDLPRLDHARVDALAGAVGEALTNAGKHGGATRVTVYAEPADAGGVTCSVRDDGSGFDVAVTQSGVGLRSSIRGRVEALGGRVDVDSRPGDGTEVRLWVP
jgi:signal transduction histidine kinase